MPCDSDALAHELITEVFTVDGLEGFGVYAVITPYLETRTETQGCCCSFRVSQNNDFALQHYLHSLSEVLSLPFLPAFTFTLPFSFHSFIFSPLLLSSSTSMPSNKVQQCRALSMSY